MLTSNGTQEAEIQVILSGGPERIQEFLVRSAISSREEIKGIPTKLSEAISLHEAHCAKARGRVWRLLPNWALVAIAFAALAVSAMGLVWR